MDSTEGLPILNVAKLSGNGYPIRIVVEYLYSSITIVINSLMQSIYKQYLFCSCKLASYTCFPVKISKQSYYHVEIAIRSFLPIFYLCYALYGMRCR